MEIPAVNLKAIVLVHWLLTTWGFMAWLPSSYAWGNFSVLGVGVWAIAQRDSLDAVLMFLVGMTMTLLTDVVHFGVYYPLAEGLAERSRDTFRFSVGMAILSLLLKPISCFFLYQMYRERGGEYNVNFADQRMSPTQENGRETGKTGRKAEKRPREATYSEPSVDRSTVDINVLGSIDEKLTKLDILDLLRSDTMELKTSVEYSHYLIGQLKTENHRTKGFTWERDSYQAIDPQDPSTISANP
ncbi:type-1 angiotensin II receptor-associated protein isoform X1 [Anguilla rostrata]|uniref:type-1 angiotensin II receptor-associated protein isoform X1 n=1 Tax=Anguilla rostrata TaxID=7938 RepID=UPI0030D56953